MSTLRLYPRFAVSLLFLLLPVFASAQYVNLKCKYTMPVAVDPDKKIFFGFNGDSGTFTGADLLGIGSSGVPGVEFHAANTATVSFNKIVLTLDSTLPPSLDPLTAEVLSVFNSTRFPGITTPWKSVEQTAFTSGIVLESQDGSALVGQRIKDIELGQSGRAYGTFILTNPGDIPAGTLDDFRALTFRATAFDPAGSAVPEPGTVALLVASVVTGGTVLRLRRTRKK